MILVFAIGCFSEPIELVEDAAPNAFVGVIVAIKDGGGDNSLSVGDMEGKLVVGNSVG